MKENFKTKFDLPRDGFSAPIYLQDTEVGFSVYKERKEPGYKSLLRVYIRNEDYKNSDEILKPVVVTASYGKETQDGITVASSEFTKKLSDPIELISKDEFFYDIKTEQLYYKETAIDGISILKNIDDQHTKTTRPFLGSPLRVKLFFYHIFLAFIVKLSFDILSFIQYLISGGKAHIYGDLSEQSVRIKQSENGSPQITRAEAIDIFGYKVEPWIAALYSIFHLTVYLILYNLETKPDWLSIIFKNDFLTLMYGIISLGLTNAVLSYLSRSNKTLSLIWLLKILQFGHFKCLSKKVKI